MTPARALRPILRRLRRRRGLTTADMAEALRIDIRTYERMASGRTRPDLHRLLELAHVLDCDPIGLIAAVTLGSPTLACACADAKVLLALALALKRLTAREIDALSRRHGLEVIAACDRLVADLLSPAGASSS